MWCVCVCVCGLFWCQCINFCGALSGRRPRKRLRMLAKRCQIRSKPRSKELTWRSWSSRRLLSRSVKYSPKHRQKHVVLFHINFLVGIFYYFSLIALCRPSKKLKNRRVSKRKRSSAWQKKVTLLFTNREAVLYFPLCSHLRVTAVEIVRWRLIGVYATGAPCLCDISVCPPYII